MLASTVQFSSYGRAQLRYERRVRTRGASFGEKLVRRAQNPPSPRLSGFLASEESIRSLRTQQRAWADPTRGLRSHLERLF